MKPHRISIPVLFFSLALFLGMVGCPGGPDSSLPGGEGKPVDANNVYGLKTFYGYGAGENGAIVTNATVTERPDGNWDVTRNGVSWILKSYQFLAVGLRAAFAKFEGHGEIFDTPLAAHEAPEQWGYNVGMCGPTDPSDPANKVLVRWVLYRISGASTYTAVKYQDGTDEALQAYEGLTRFHDEDLGYFHYRNDTFDLEFSDTPPGGAGAGGGDPGAHFEAKCNGTGDTVQGFGSLGGGSTF